MTKCPAPLHPHGPNKKPKNQKTKKPKNHFILKVLCFRWEAKMQEFWEKVVFWFFGFLVSGTRQRRLSVPRPCTPMSQTKKPKNQKTKKPLYSESLVFSLGSKKARVLGKSGFLVFWFFGFGHPAACRRTSLQKDFSTEGTACRRAQFVEETRETQEGDKRETRGVF